MNTSSPLFPIPKIWIPAVAALVAILISWVISGDFAEAELAALLTTLAYFVLGYVLPGAREGGSGEGGRRGGGARRASAPTREERY